MGMSHSILVVEDDRDFSLQLVSMFEFSGLEVSTASTGPAALEAFASQPTDLVLVDVMLPRTHGLTVVDQLRDLPGGADVPVLMMSAVYGAGDLSQRDLDRLGVLEYLTKPFSLLELGRRVAALLASPDGGRDVVRALRDKYALGAADELGVDLITDSMTAVPDFLADVLAGVTDADDDVGGDAAPGEDYVVAGDDDEEEDSVVEVLDEGDEPSPAEDEYSFDGGSAEIDFATGSFAAAEEEEDPAGISGFALIAEPSELSRPEPPPPRTPPPRVDVEVEVEIEPEGPGLGSFEIEVEMDRSGSFAAVAEDEEPAPADRGDPVLLVRLMSGQDAMPSRVVSALVTAQLAGSAGRLRLLQDGGHRELLFLNGYPVWCDVEPFDQGLARWLVEQKHLTAVQGTKMRTLREKRGWSIPRILGAIQRSPEQIDELLQGWVADQVAAAVEWRGRMLWVPGDGFSDEVPVYEVNAVRALWPSVLKQRLGRLELDLAHLEGRTLSRTADALRLLDRLPETSALNTLQSTLSRPTPWHALLPAETAQREETLRLLWVLDAGGCLTEAEDVDPGVSQPRGGAIETRRIPRSVVNSIVQRSPAPAAKPAEERVREDWLRKMGESPFEFLELPEVVDTNSVRKAYAALGKRWRLDPGQSLVHGDSARKSKELMSKLRSSFQEVLAELQSDD